MKILLILVFTFLSLNLLAQRELNGYGKYKFGTTKKVIAESLKSKNISFDTLISHLGYEDPENYISFYEIVKVDTVWLNSLVHLSFDRRNNNEFYFSLVKIRKHQKSVKEGMDLCREIILRFNEKFGNYDTISNNLNGKEYIVFPTAGRTIDYIWKFKNGEIKMNCNFYYFFKTEPMNESQVLREDGGDLVILIQYTSKDLEDRYNSSWEEEQINLQKGY